MSDISEADLNQANAAAAVPQGEEDPNAARPGRILGAANLKIQTRQAQRLVYGRRRTADKNQIIGMLQFGFFVQKIWSAAMMDDPYADWYLLKVHDALERGRDEIAEMKQEVEELLKSMSNLQIDIAHSIEPILIPVQFPNPFGYMGAYLIADYDDLTISLLTCRHFGLMDRNTAEKKLARGASIVRRTFMSSAGWKNTGVTRSDFLLPTSDGKVRAQQSVELMGECPPKVLDGSLRSSMAPQVRNRPVELQNTMDAAAGEHQDEEADESAPEAVAAENGASQVLADTSDDGDDDLEVLSMEEIAAQVDAQVQTDDNDKVDSSVA